MSKILIIIFSIFAAFSQASYGCSCSFLSLEGAYKSSDLVFIGTVTKIKKVKEASVGLVLKESGTLEFLKEPRWELTYEKINSVTLRIDESFKNTKDKTITLTTSPYNGGGSCGVSFRKGEKFLVFAYKNESYAELNNKSQDETSETEKKLNSIADRFNTNLPIYGTSICSRTERIRFMDKEVEEIRSFLKSGIWSEKYRDLPSKILYQQSNKILY